MKSEKRVNHDNAYEFINMLFINLYIFSIQTSAIYLPTNKVSIFDII